MATDPNAVRVDLLKVKRKLYVSYENSLENQKNFLLSTKKTELSYFAQQLPKEVSEHVFTEHEKALKLEYTHIGFSLFIGMMGFSIFLVFWKAFPHHIWLLYTAFAPLLYGLMSACFHGQHVIDANKKIKPFRDDYQMIQTQIARLNSELKQIE